MNQFHAVIGAAVGLVFVYLVFWLWIHTRPSKIVGKTKGVKRG